MARILIVDDSITSRKMLKNILMSDGHEIIGEAKNGEEAIELYQKLSPDLVTMDITMPVMNGLDALKGIKEADSNAKVIMVSSSGQSHKMIDAIKLGAVEFQPKPYVTEEFLKAVHRALGE